jgi:hypothetical protein
MLKALHLNRRHLASRTLGRRADRLAAFAVGRHLRTDAQA